jgi:glycerol uptake facilitator-like aquaporin
MFGKAKIAVLVSEFLGTGILTLLILSVQRSTIGVPFFVALAAGLTLALLVFALGNTLTTHLNPAITLASWTARRINTLTGVLYIAMQLLGAWAAYWLYTYYVGNGLQPVGGHFTARILVAEAVGTAVFAFGWAAATSRALTAGANAAYAGLAYMLGIVAASSAAIGLLNPAVALGVRAWVWGTYVLGPIVGAIIGINLYNLLFAEQVVAGKAAATVAPAATSTARANGSRTTAKKRPAKKTASRRK